MKQLLVDTNVLLLLTRQPEKWPFYEEHFGEQVAKSYISVVSVAELRSLSLQNKWGDARQRRMEEILKGFAILDINIEEVIQRYAEIDAFSQGKLEGKPAAFSARNMGKNDLWIAATAAAFDLELLTTDRDFDHIDGFFLKVNLIVR